MDLKTVGIRQRAQAFLQAFLERAAEGHRFAAAFDRSGVSVERRKLLNGGFLPKAATPACGNFSKAKRVILVTM